MPYTQLTQVQSPEDPREPLGSLSTEQRAKSKHCMKLSDVASPSPPQKKKKRVNWIQFSTTAAEDQLIMNVGKNSHFISWTELLHIFFCYIVCLVCVVGGHTQLCSEITHGYTLRAHS